MQQHIFAEHPNGSLAVSPLLVRPLGRISLFLYRLTLVLDASRVICGRFSWQTTPMAQHGVHCFSIAKFEGACMRKSPLRSDREHV